MPNPCDLRRRRLICGAATVLAAASCPGSWAWSPATPEHRRIIPKSGEAIPAIGMGSWITFNVGGDRAARANCVKVLRAFFEAGGTVIDSSPMYGSSEAVIGHCLKTLGRTGEHFSATKIWTPFTSRGPGQVNDSLALWHSPRLDLLQIHNLLNWQEHLATLRRLKAEGVIRYLGVTTSHGRRHAELEAIMTREPLDFVQLTYNILDREAEARLLPLARERGIAVLVNRPFQRNGLFQRFGAQPLPALAGELGCDNWAQYFLKFIISHPAVTCAIPATSQVAHMRENMAVLRGPLPDAAQRRQMVAELASR